MSPTRKSASEPASSGRADEGFSAEERAAMKERARELKADSKSGRRADKALQDEKAVLDTIAALPDHDRALAERVHALVKASAPGLSAKLWYGMPAYAKDGKVVCFFQGAQKFSTRYATLGFSDKANLDDGDMWPAAFALVRMSPASERRITELLEQAVS